MSERLVERGGERAGVAHPLQRGVLTIGRADDNDIVVHSVHVSRHHAEVRWDGSRYLLQDLGSKNGTFLNGRRIEGPQPLRPGDIITIPDLELAYSASDETATLFVKAFSVAALYIDPKTAEVWVRGQQVKLTPKEYFALALLYEHQGALVSKETLAMKVWPEYEGLVGDESIQELISRLRRKLEENPEQPRYLVTVRGLGYRLVIPKEVPAVSRGPFSEADSAP